MAKIRSTAQNRSYRIAQDAIGRACPISYPSKMAGDCGASEGGQGTFRDSVPVAYHRKNFASRLSFFVSGVRAGILQDTPTTPELPTTTQNYPFLNAIHGKRLQTKAHFETIKDCVFQHFPPQVVDARVFLGAGGRTFKSCRPDSS